MQFPALFLLMAFFTLSATTSLPSSVSPLLVEELIGEVFLQSSGEKKAQRAKKKMKLKKGDRLQSRSKASLDILFPNGSKLRIASNTFIEIKKIKENPPFLMVGITLHRGAIRFASDHKKNNLLQLKVKSKNASFQPRDGDHFFYYLAKENVSGLYTLKGSAHVSSSHGKNRVKEYQMLRVTSKKKDFFTPRKFTHLPEKNLPGKMANVLYAEKLKPEKVKQNKDLKKVPFQSQSTSLIQTNMEDLFTTMEKDIQPRNASAPLVKPPRLLFLKRQRDESSILYCFKNEFMEKNKKYCEELKKHLKEQGDFSSECKNQDSAVKKAELCLSGFPYEKFPKANPLKYRCEKDLIFRGRNLLACRKHLRLKAGARIEFQTRK